jgi:hypothetical protein
MSWLLNQMCMQPKKDVQAMGVLLLLLLPLVTVKRSDLHQHV